MFDKTAWLIARRYAFGFRDKKFISLISWISVIGIFLGVFSLIVVLSVMNGYDKELKKRILSVVPEVIVNCPKQYLASCEKNIEINKNNIVAKSKIINTQAMILDNNNLGIVDLKGITPSDFYKVINFSQDFFKYNLEKLVPGKFNIIIGRGLADKYGWQIGEKISLISPVVKFNIAGITPIIKQFKIAAIFDLDYKMYDEDLVFINILDANKFLKNSAPEAIQLKTADLLQAPIFANKLKINLKQYNPIIKDWTDLNNNFFKAVQLEKTVITIILLLIVAVALFNVLATLVMTVFKKQAQISILRALGISKNRIIKIFILQGLIISSMGIIFGVVLGVPTAIYIRNITEFIENVLNINIFSNQAAIVSYLPSMVMWQDVMVIILVAFGLSLLLTIYPAFRAAKIIPAKILKNE